MLNRLRSVLNEAALKGTKSVDASAASTSGRYRRVYNKNGRTPVIITQTPAGVATAAPAPASGGASKFFRYGAFILVGGYMFSRALFDQNNPSSPLNQLIYPNKGKAKWILKVERLDDKITSYQNAYLMTAKGITSALRNQSKHIALQRLGLQVFACSFISACC
jgi:hypothetical protein